MSFYLDISGVRLDQTTLFAIAEAVMAHGLWLLLLAIINCRCLRPLAPRPRWVGAWRVHTTVYAIMAIATEVMWVQLGLIMGPKGVRENAIGCEWSLEHLMAWTMFQTLSLSSVLFLCSYCRRGPVGHMITSYIGVHAMGLMTFSMMGMNEQGACASDVFPLVTAMVGMSFMCCCFPWHVGAWRIDYPHQRDLEARDDEPRDEREVLTCWGWRMLERYLRLHPRPYRGEIAHQGEMLDADEYEQSKISMLLFGETGAEERRQGAATGPNGHHPRVAEEVRGFQGESEEDDSEEDDDDDEREEVEEEDGGAVVTAKGDGRGRDATPLEDLPSVADTMRLEPFVANPQEWSSKAKSTPKARGGGRGKGKGKKEGGRKEGKDA